MVKAIAINNGQWGVKMKLLLLLLLTIFAISNAVAGGIQWHGYSNSIYHQTTKKNHHILIYAMSNTCHWCEKMNTTTFKNPKIIKIINRYFYPVRVNAGDNSKVVARLGLKGVPTIVILDANGSINTMLAGYIEPDKLAQQLAEIAGVQ